MSNEFPSGLYSHNPYAIEAGIEDDLPLVDIDRKRRKLAIPQKTELLSFLATLGPTDTPRTARKLVKRLIKLGVTAAFPVTDGVTDLVAVGVFDRDKYIANYNRGIKYRCVAAAIDPVVVVPETVTLFGGDLKRLTKGYSNRKQSSGKKLKGKAARVQGKGLKASDFLRRVVDQTVEVDWKEVCASSRLVIPTLKNSNADRKFWAPTIEIVKETIDRSEVPERRYMSERFDCDDFARCLHADFILSGITAIGVVYDDASRHAYLAVSALQELSSSELEIVFLEPQRKSFDKASIPVKEGKLLIEGKWTTPRGEIRW